MFGLKEAEVAELVRAISGPATAESTAEGPANAVPATVPSLTAVPPTPTPTLELDRAAIEERFARATWSGIAEPGDRVAGEVIASIGPAMALSALVDKWSVDRFAAELGHPESLSNDDLELAIKRWHPRVSSGAALIALRQAARCGARLRIPGDPFWPEGMVDLTQFAPLALWTRGTEEAYRGLANSIALVGARAATGYGEHVAMEASAGLVDRGYTIVSGAAYGIDGMAHRAALASHGRTVAFLAGGVDRFYTSGHDALLERIVKSGVVMAELPCGSSPTKWRFLQRNRLIAAASQATVVIEAGWRSGSLNTAHHAADLGRPVGAVPGPVTSAASAGCHRLFRENLAVCVTQAAEMAQLVSMGPDESLVAGPTDGAPRVSDELTRLHDAMSVRSPRTAANIAARAGLSVQQVRSLLGQCDLDGTAVERPSGWVLRLSS